MADNEKNVSQPPQLCKQGCGFYGSSNFDGMCSKCYKDFEQRKSGTTGVVGRASASSGTSDRAALSAAFASAVEFMKAGSRTEELATTVEASAEAAASVEAEVVSVKSEAQAAVSCDKPSEPSGSGTPAPAPDAPVPSSAAPKQPNRCDTCKKKVGLTGFGCRCGGTFCGEHRYSDRHACQFDYKEHGAQQLRKLNPVVVADKVTKI